MTNLEIYKVLLNHYGSMLSVANRAGCSRNSVRNFLYCGMRSRQASKILDAALEEMRQIKERKEAEVKAQQKRGKELVKLGQSLITRSALQDI